jgi:hypothetical protein
MFFRARLFQQNNLFFKPDLRIVGDLEWLSRAMEAGARIKTLDFFTSTFSDLGTNLALSEAAALEIRPATSRTLRHQISDATMIASHRLRRLVAGHYSLRPFHYSIYTLEHHEGRQTFCVDAPTGVWRNRL